MTITMSNASELEPLASGSHVSLWFHRTVRPLETLLADGYFDRAASVLNAFDRIFAVACCDHHPTHMTVVVDEVGRDWVRTHVASFDGDGGRYAPPPATALRLGADGLIERPKGKAAWREFAALLEAHLGERSDVVAEVASAVAGGRPPELGNAWIRYERLPEPMRRGLAAGWRRAALDEAAAAAAEG